MFQKLLSFFKKRKKNTLNVVTKPSVTTTSKTNLTSQTQVTNMTKAYFSPGEDCVNAIVQALQNAKKSIDICVFTISDDKISREIIACHRKNIKVRIITDNEKLHDLGSDIAQMAKAGITIRIDNTTAHMHHKFMIADGTTLVNGSYNWTKSAATANEENIIVSDEKDLIAAFTKQFEKMWKGMEAYSS